MLTFQHIASILKLQSLSPHQWKSTSYFKSIIQKLSQHQYALQLFNQLLTHCNTNPKGDISVDQFIKTILDVQRKMVHKAKDKADRINSLTKYKQSLQINFNKSADYAVKRQLQIQINDIAAEMQENQVIMSQARQNLLIIRTTFGKTGIAQQIIHQSQNQPNQSRIDIKALIILTVCNASLQLLSSSYKANYLNLLIACFLMALFFLDYFQKYFIRLVLCLIGITILFDILWLAIKSKQVWNIPPRYWGSFSVVCTGITMIIKIICTILLFKYRVYDRIQKLDIEMFSFKFIFGGNIQNPISMAIKKSVGLL